MTRVMRCESCAQPIDFNFGESKFMHVLPMSKECNQNNPIPGEQTNEE